MIRDGRDVALSVLDRTVRDVDRGRRRPPLAASKIQQGARRDAPKLDHYIEVRYEDLILDTEPSLRRICEFIELPWDEAMLDYHERSARAARGDEARASRATAARRSSSVERRMATHAMTTKPPDAERVSRWQHADERPSSGRRSRRSPATSCASSATRWTRAEGEVARTPTWPAPRPI